MADLDETVLVSCNIFWVVYNNLCMQYVFIYAYYQRVASIFDINREYSLILNNNFNE